MKDPGFDWRIFNVLLLKRVLDKEILNVWVNQKNAAVCAQPLPLIR